VETSGEHTRLSTIPYHRRRSADAPFDERSVSELAAHASLLYGLGAYAWWGLAPAYFKAPSHVPAATMLGHRIAWSVLLLVLLVSWVRQWPQVRGCDPRG